MSNDITICEDIITVVFNYCDVKSIYKLRCINRKYNNLYNNFYESYKKKYKIDELFDNLHGRTKKINFAILKKDIILSRIDWNKISKYKMDINFIDIFQNMINWGIYIMWNDTNLNILEKYHNKINWDIVTIYNKSILSMDNNIEKINVELLFLNKGYISNNKKIE